MTTVLESLIADVYAITNRPDLVNETYTAIRSATLKAHQSDFYPKDLFEAVIKFDTEEYLQSFDYRSIFQNWRAIKYLRKYDNISGVAGNFIDIITIDQTLDNYSLNRDNVCYLAGANLQIRSNTKNQYYIIGLYQHPTVTLDGFNSWIALEHPFAIVFDAARILFKMIGYDEQSAAYERLTLEQYQELKSQILAIGW